MAPRTTERIGGLNIPAQLAIAVALATAIAACGPSKPPEPEPAESSETTNNVVYDINYDEPRKLFSALHSIENYLKAVDDPNADIRVVLHGPGVSLLLEPDALPIDGIRRANATPTVEALVSELKDEGVTFSVDRHTLTEQRIDYHQDLYDVEPQDLVDSGFAEIARLQQLGYRYLKP